MMGNICLLCKIEDDTYLCQDCRKNLREKYSDYSEYTEAVFHLVDSYPKKEKDYILGCILCGNNSGVNKENRQWLYKTFRNRKLDKYLPFESARIRGWLLDALWQDYEYEEAEEIASKLLICEDLPYTSVLSMADYFTKTRRYEIAASLLKQAYPKYAFDECLCSRIELRIEDNTKRYQSSFDGKGEYLPNPRENKELIRQKYIDFLATLGKTVEIKKPKVPHPIAKEYYPHLKVVTSPKFKSFVAFDFETTGFSPSKDSIIEIGAVKVIDGKVDTSKNGIFSEFVKPYRSTVSSKITEITGISSEDVKDAREMWEVVPDFLAFAGKLPLVGYNNARFDNQFLERAGRYSHIIINNSTFDVMQYAKKNKELYGLGPCFKLGDVSTKLKIKNPAAHRAYADAITTAKVLLKLMKK